MLCPYPRRRGRRQPAAPGSGPRPEDNGVIGARRRLLEIFVRRWIRAALDPSLAVDHQRRQVLRAARILPPVRGVEASSPRNGDSDAQWLQVSVRPTGTYWMEEVGEEDYLGNDIGIRSREEFLRTGVREKNPSR